MTDGYYYCLNCHSEITPDYNEHCSFCGTAAIAVPGDYTNEEVERAFDLLNKEEEGRIIVPTCKVGDTVYVISDCSRIMMHYDNDYFTGTGAIECPYEDACKFTECNDENTQVLETCVSHLLNDEYDDWTFGCEKINCCYNFSDIGKTVFLTPEEAEKALKEGADNR